MKNLAVTTLLGAVVNAADTVGDTKQLLGLIQKPQTTSTNLNVQTIQSNDKATSGGIQTQTINLGSPIQLAVNDPNQQGSIITITSQTSSSSSSGTGGAQSSFGAAQNAGGAQISGGLQSNFGGAQFGGAQSGGAQFGGAQSGFDGAISVSAGGAGSASGLGSALSGATGNQIILNGNNQAQIQAMLLSMRNQGQIQPGQQTQIFQQNSVGIINNAMQNIARPQIAFDSIFVRFPTIDELDRIIISGDSTALLKTIQTVIAESTVKCDQKMAYLLELLGRLRTAVQKKSRLAVKLKVVIQSSITQIQKLQAEQDGIRKQLNQLGLEDLKANQRKINKELQDKYGVQNDVQSQLPVLQASLMGLLKEIQILKNDSENQRSRSGNDQLKILQMRSEMGKIQSRLSELLDLQAAIRDRIGKSEGISVQNDTKIKQLRNKIAAIKIDIKRLSTDQDTSRTTVKDLQVRVQRLRTDLSIAQTKKDTYTRQIKTLEDKIAVEKKKSDNNTLNSLNEMISNLKDILPSVTAAVDKHYYTCFGAGSSIKITKNGDSTVYVINGSRVGDYLKSLYGGTVKIPGINGDIAFTRVDIFSPQWAGKYGYPMSKAAFNNEDFSFSGSFSCNNPNMISTGYGTISSIGPDFIQASDQKGASKRFVLGSCSRLQSTQQIPRVGQRMFWQGTVGSRGINLYSGSCME